ncbi:recombinase family protein [Larkinella sp. C7]|uniref:recombinase family protein n=1 Tax=Larkinella sp. C7 TaxID=2576607 RepID=UPI001111353E|nr:recombinase family protein [Larkinella sp. C7]
MIKAIAYYRVSTDRQGKSGLGLEAQQEAVRLFADRQGYQVTTHFTEIESGKKNNRPELLAALAQCRKEKATLIIAKLDRLGRNVAFIANLMESKVQFKAVDNPYADELMIHLLAAFAQHERKQISSRTKDALQAAIRRGVQLGKHGKEVQCHKEREAADEFAERIRPTVEEIQRQGITTIRAMCEEMNRRQVPTYRTNAQGWHIRTVHALLRRLQTHRNLLETSF